MAKNNNADLRAAAEKVWVEELANQIRSAWATDEAIASIQWGRAEAERNNNTTTNTQNNQSTTQNVAEWYDSSQVWIPWVNVNVEWGQPTQEFEQQEEVQSIETPWQAWENVTEQIRDDVAQIPENIREIEEQEVQRAEEDREFRDQEIDRTEEFFDNKSQIEEQNRQRIEESEQRVRGLIEERNQRDTEQLREQKASELERLEREKEVQSVRDKQAIIDAEKAIEVNKQQSAWAYQKLWLNFSSGIINTSQQIATEWATQIAWLKVQANYNQADIAYKASQIEFEYTSEINNMIDTYTDAQLELEQSVQNRIYEAQKNTLLDEESKQTRISELEREYRNSTRERENQIRAETERLRDKSIERSIQLQSQLQQEEDRNRVEIESKISTWQWSNLSVEQKNKQAKKAWLTVEEVDRMSWGVIWAGSIQYAKSIIGDDFMFSPNELSSIKADANYYSSIWYSLEEATNLATNKIIQSNPRYKTLQELRGLEEQAARRQLTAKYTSSDTGKTETFQPKRTDLFADKSWNVMAIYPDWIARPIYWEQTRTELEQVANPKPWTPIQRVPVTRTWTYPISNIRGVWTTFPDSGSSSSSWGEESGSYWEEQLNKIKQDFN